MIWRSWAKMSKWCVLSYTITTLLMPWMKVNTSELFQVNLGAIQKVRTQKIVRVCNWRAPHDFFFVEKVPICIVRGLYCMEIIEINTFEHFIFLKRVFFFASQLSCSYPFASWEENRNTFYNNHVIHINLVYVKTSLFVYCKNISFHIKTVVVWILWTIFVFVIKVFLQFSQPASYSEKISQPDGNWWGTPFLRNSSWGCSSLTV